MAPPDLQLALHEERLVTVPMERVVRDSEPITCGWEEFRERYVFELPGVVVKVTPKYPQYGSQIVELSPIQTTYLLFGDCEYTYLALFLEDFERRAVRRDDFSEQDFVAGVHRITSLVSRL